MPNFNFWVQGQKFWNGFLQDLNYFKIHFWVQDQKLWNGHPKIGKILNSFLSSCSKVVEWTPQGWKHFWIHFWVQDQMLWNGPPELGKKLSSFLSSDQKLWNRPPKIAKFLNSFLSSGSKVVEWASQFWHLVEILEILLLHILSNDACKFAINLFPISWEPFENVNLLFFLLKMQIWNVCNALNIGGNPIKDINAKL